MYARVFITSRCCKWILSLRSMTFYLIIRLPPPLALQAQALALKRSGNANVFHRLIPRK